MDAWVIWLLLGVAFAVGEVLTISFFLAPFALGGFAAAIVSAVGAGPEVSTAVFAVTTAGSLWLVRPIAKRHLRQPSSTKTGTAALIGRTGVVIKPLGPSGSVHELGQVRVEGEVWTARTAGIDEIDAGQVVTVLEIQGATVVVTD